MLVGVCFCVFGKTSAYGLVVAIVFQTATRHGTGTGTVRHEIPKQDIRSFSCS